MDGKTHKEDREILGALLMPVEKAGKGPMHERMSKGSDDADTDEGVDMDVEEQISAVADELFDAVKADDREGFREGLRSYVSMCRIADGE